MDNIPELNPAITDLRRDYLKGGLRRRDLPKNPILLFEQWLEQACAAQLPDPTAMIVATVDQHGQPWQRIVLLKHYDAESLTFYTNLKSRKAVHLQHNSRISLLFPWHILERQVMVLGNIEKLSLQQVEQYFHSRPRASQLGAWSSPQSQPIVSREILEDNFRIMTESYQNQPVPLPSFWGGYRVNFHTLEFWQGGARRLHDRFIYQKQGGCWKIDRLAP